MRLRVNALSTHIVQVNSDSLIVAGNLGTDNGLKFLRMGGNASPIYA